MKYSPIRTTLSFAGQGVHLRFKAPPEDLEPFVVEFWEYDIDEEVGVVPVQILPNGCLLLRINILPHDVEAVIYGPSILGKMQGLMFSSSIAFGAVIKPDCAYFLMGLSIAELRDYRLHMEEFWPLLATELKSRMSESESFEERTKTLCSFLRTVLRENSLPTTDFLSAYYTLLKSPQEKNLDLIMRHQSMTGRTLRRQFHKFLGLSPKEMTRVLRFQRTLNQFRNQPEVSLANLAVDEGYFDQSHLNREFKQFTSLSPATFRNQIGQYQDRELEIWNALPRYNSPYIIPHRSKFS